MIGLTKSQKRLNHGFNYVMKIKKRILFLTIIVLEQNRIEMPGITIFLILALFKMFLNL